MFWYIISFFGFTFLNILYFFKYSYTNIFHRRSFGSFDGGIIPFHLKYILKKIEGSSKFENLKCPQ